MEKNLNGWNQFLSEFCNNKKYIKKLTEFEWSD